MRRIRLLAVSLLLAVAGCGGDDEAPAPAGNGADREFAQAMVPHHELAVEMAQIARTRAESEFVRDLARDIIRTQTAEIASLRAEDRELAAEQIEPGGLGVPEDQMGMEHDAASLRRAKSFDKAFLEAMVPHHQGAITMAKAEIAKGADPELKALAQQIIAAQEREIAEMREHLGDPGAEHGGAHPG